MTAKQVTSVVVGLAIGFAVTMWFVSHSQVPSVSGAFESPDAAKSFWGSALTAGYGFTLTLIGVGLGSAYRRLINLKAKGTDKVKIGALVRDVFSSVDFLMGIVGSPIVFGLLWKALDDISLPGLTIIALQNGFASHAILDQAIKGDQKPKRGGSAAASGEKPPKPGKKG